jgi:type I restriction enzyme S subunit
VFASYLIRYRPIVHPRWVYYFLQSPYYWSRISEETAGIALQNVNASKLDALILPVPPANQQERIVKRIDELFAEIDDGEAALVEARSGVETYRKALLKAAVTGELTADWRRENPTTETGQDLLNRILTDRRRKWEGDPKNRKKRYPEPVSPLADELPELPPSWTWATLQQLAFISGGATVDQKRQPADPVDVPYLRVANVQRGRLDLSKMKSITIEAANLAALSLQDGDLLLNEGGDRDKVGRGWVWRNELPVCVHQNHVFKARPASSVIRSELVSAYLNEMGRKFFIDESKQTTNLASISLSKVSLAPVPVPPPREADAILQLIQRYERASGDDTIEAASRAAADLRQSILSAAFRGELV